ncbi:7TM diverse intracellular signaling domain-containing protein [Allohahella sp. A8]|uniref:7TM diverse intracellular signaling domain-containing protein n=1 Tax=Allohahella sp. A8 TaxID=3141461 RepID=UPI003A7F7601
MPTLDTFEPSGLVKPLLLFASLMLILVLSIALPHRSYELVEQQTLNRSDLQISEHLNWYEDVDERFDYRDIRNRPADRQLRFGGRAWLDKTLSAEPVWLSFEVALSAPDPGREAGAAANLFLDFGFATLDEVDVYLLNQDGELMAHLRSGDTLARPDRPLPLNRPVFPIDLAPGQQRTVIVRIYTDSFLNTPVAINDAAQSMVGAAQLSFIDGVFYGAMAAMFFYNLHIYIIVRRRSYLYYLGYALSMTLYQAFSDGLLNDWTNQAWLQHRRLALSGGISTIMLLSFVRSILSLRQTLPTMSKIMGLLIAMTSLACVIELVHASNATSMLMLLLGLAACVAVPAAGILASIRGHALARSFLLAWLAYPVFFITYIAVMAGLLPPSHDAINALKVGIALESIFLSLALAAYINQLRRQQTAHERAWTVELEQQLDTYNEAADDLARGNYKRRLKFLPEQRLARLAESFNYFAASTERYVTERRRWVSDISHELRTPVTSVRGMVESIQTGAMTASAENLAILHQESLRLERLITDLNQLSQSEEGILVMKTERVDIHAVITELLTANAQRLESASLTAQLEFEVIKPALIGDEGRLHQLFANLLENSLRYCHAPGRIHVSSCMDQNSLTLRWSDSAPGVPADQHTKLFERLFRGDPSRSRRTGGAGLGLAICKAIVEGHHGQLNAEPSPLGGLTIAIHLPFTTCSTASRELP